MRTGDEGLHLGRRIAPRGRGVDDEMQVGSVGGRELVVFQLQDSDGWVVEEPLA